MQTLHGANPQGGRHARRADQGGFTLVELVMVIMLLSILSFFAVSRMSARGDTDAHGFAAQAGAALRFAQKAAIAQRRSIYVNVDTGSARIWACLSNAPGCQPLLTPAGGALDHSAPTGISLANSGPAQFSFDALGRPSEASAIDLTIAADASSFTVRIEPESGYVHQL